MADAATQLYLKSNPSQTLLTPYHARMMLSGIHAQTRHTPVPRQQRSARAWVVPTESERSNAERALERRAGARLRSKRTSQNATEGDRRAAMIAKPIRAEEVPATLAEVRAVLARLEERDLGHWTSRQGRRLRLFRYRPALSLRISPLPLDATIVDAQATRLFGGPDVAHASWIIYLLSEGETPIGYAALVATEGPERSVRVQVFDGCFLPFPDLACAPVGEPLVEFSEALLREIGAHLPVPGKNESADIPEPRS